MDSGQSSNGNQHRTERGIETMDQPSNLGGMLSSCSFEPLKVCRWGTNR